MKTNTITAIVTFLIVGIISVAGFALSLFLRGWALIWLWHWYAEPFGLMSLTFWHAVGLSLLVAFFTYELNDNSPEGQEPGATIMVSVLKSMFFSLAMLFFGFIYQFFM